MIKDKWLAKIDIKVTVFRSVCNKDSESCQSWTKLENDYPRKSGFYGQLYLLEIMLFEL